MAKLTARLVTALLTFLIGVSIATLWSGRHRKVATSEPTSVSEAVVQEAMPLPYEGWRKVTVQGQFSFLIPQYLDDDGHYISSREAVGAFRKGGYDMSGLFHLYYRSHREVQGNGNSPDRFKSTTRSQVVIDGKNAMIVTEIPALEEVMCIHDVPVIQVYFPDIGRGQKLYMRLASGDGQGIEVARQIIKSIDFE